MKNLLLTTSFIILCSSACQQTTEQDKVTMAKMPKENSISTINVTDSILFNIPNASISAKDVTLVYAQNRYYMIEMFGKNIHVFDEQGGFVKTLNNDSFTDSPTGIAASPSNSIVVAQGIHLAFASFDAQYIKVGQVVAKLSKKTDKFYTKYAPIPFLYNTFIDEAATSILLPVYQTDLPSWEEDKGYYNTPLVGVFDTKTGSLKKTFGNYHSSYIAHYPTLNTLNKVSVAFNPEKNTVFIGQGATAQIQEFDIEGNLLRSFGQEGSKINTESVLKNAQTGENIYPKNNYFAMYYDRQAQLLQRVYFAYPPNTLSTPTTSIVNFPKYLQTYKDGKLVAEIGLPSNVITPIIRADNTKVMMCKAGEQDKIVTLYTLSPSIAQQ